MESQTAGHKGHQGERITYFEQFEKQWEHYQTQKRKGNYQQSLFEGSPALSQDDKNRDGLEQAQQGKGPLTPQSFEPWIFHPNETRTVLVEYTIESGKAHETFPPAWMHQHGQFDQSLDVERVVFINGKGMRYWI